MEFYQTILIKHWDRLQRLCESLCIKHKKLYLADDMFCEAIVDKCERAFTSFDPTKNDNVEEYMLSCFRYYCRDWLAKYFRHVKEHDLRLYYYDKEDDDRLTSTRLSYNESSALLARDEVIAILSVLPTFERRLLTLRIGYSWTFPEIAKALNQPESSVRVACNEALLKAQWFAKQRIKRDVV